MCMNACGIIASIISSISHSLSSSSLFLMAGVLINKVYTRYYESFFFLDQIMRTLLLFIMLTNLGFAMTLNFVGEMFALIGLVSIVEDRYHVYNTSQFTYKMGYICFIVGLLNEKDSIAINSGWQVNEIEQKGIFDSAMDILYQMPQKT